jgi:hypothetical protein
MRLVIRIIKTSKNHTKTSEVLADGSKEEETMLIKRFKFITKFRITEGCNLIG